jgi:lipid-A-disaccharide synthase
LTPSDRPRIFLSCGEPSGDLYAGALARELRAIAPSCEVSGRGGPEFVRGGGHLLADYRGLAVTGFTEFVSKVPALNAAKRRLVTAAKTARPHVLVVIDYFGFNVRLARDFKALGIPVVYYISPQIWAWRPGRIKTIRTIADRVLVIFPFEEAIYRKADVPVEFVGHPLIDLVHTSVSRGEFLRRLGLHSDRPTVALLPGSRTGELRRILPTLVEAARRIRSQVPGAQFVIARATNLDDQLFEPARGMHGLHVVEGETDTVIAASDLVLTASGTATVQTALHDKPMVVVYRVSPLEYRIGRPFVHLDTFAMVNLIAGERLVPELIQDAFTPEAVAQEAVSFLTDPQRVERIRQGLAGVRRKLGGPGASRRAAAAILKIAERTCGPS